MTRGGREGQRDEIATHTACARNDRRWRPLAKGGRKDRNSGFRIKSGMTRGEGGREGVGVELQRSHGDEIFYMSVP